MPESRLDKLAHILVRFSTRVQSGDLVRLVGTPAAQDLLLRLYAEVLAAGGHPIVQMEPEACTELLLRHGNENQLRYVSPVEEQLVKGVDVSIHVLAPENTRALTQVSPGRQFLLGAGRRPLLETFLRRAAEGSLRWVVTQLPCQAVAQEADMSLAEYTELLESACLLDRPDPVAAWKEISQRQDRLIEHLRGARELRFHDLAGTDLRVGVAGRTWINSDGRENLPDGEVFTGPIEDATEGVVVFGTPTLHKGREVSGIRLVFKAGKVVEASATKGEEYLLGLLDQDAGARRLGEVALGCNYALARLTRNALLDEKIGGTFHTALGASYPATGGKNISSLHWDLVGDLRTGGQIEADGQVISRDGRFLNSSWPRPD